MKIRMRIGCLALAALCLAGAAPAAPRTGDSCGPDRKAVPAPRGTGSRPAGSVQTTGAAPQADTLRTDTLSVLPPTAEQTVNQRRSQRGLVDGNGVFVPRGQWVTGGYVSYSSHTNDNYTFFVFENISSDGYSFKISPMVGYALRNNSVVGARLIYDRTLLKVFGGEINLGDEESGTHLTADYYYSLRHNYSLAFIWRRYIPLGNNKRFALFNEMSLTAGSHQSKFAANEPIRGTYETGYSASLGVSPGLIAFVNNLMAVEINVGVMGINYESDRQVHNRVEEARITTSSMNFRINPLAIGLGISFYL